MADVVQLSEREREILKLVATGATNQQIATDLGISINTVKVHLRNVFGKIGAASRTEATLYAVRNGLVEGGKAVISANETLPEPSLLQQPIVQNPLPSTAQPITQPSSAIPAEPSSSPSLQRGLMIGIGTVGGLAIALLAIWLLGFRTGPQTPPTPTASIAQATNATASWVSQRDLPVGLGAAAGASVDGRIYILGGKSSAGASAQVWRYDPSTNAWAALPEKPTPIFNAQAAVLGGKIYIPGGEQGDGSISDTLDVYDPVAQSWETKAKLPQPRAAYGLAAVDGRVYLFGGTDGTQARAEVFEYDPATDSWRELEPMPTARAYGAAVAFDGKIYVLGGEAQGSELSANEQFTPSIGGKGSWAKVIPLEQPRSRFGASAVGNNIVVIGGTKNEEPTRYDVRSSIWERFKAPALPLGSQPTVITRDSSIFVAAGDPSKAATIFYELRLLYQVTISLP
jgi:DNA-binding CsgD family transcriptional regulator